jgi:hypothetical protein
LFKSVADTVFIQLKIIVTALVLNQVCIPGFGIGYGYPEQRAAIIYHSLYFFPKGVEDLTKLIKILPN